MVIRICGAVLAGARSVLEVDICNGVVLPGHFCCESDVMALTLSVYQLDVAARWQ
jgi:hypothetical protein